MSDYFLALEHPAEARKFLLSSAKHSVLILKSQYRLREVRKEKVALLAELVEVMDTLSQNLSTLSEKLPEHNAKSMPAVVERMKKADEERVAKIKAKVQGKIKPKNPLTSDVSEPETPLDEPHTEKAEKSNLHAQAESALSQLESKLAAIESKLNKL